MIAEQPPLTARDLLHLSAVDMADAVRACERGDHAEALYLLRMVESRTTRVLKLMGETR